MLPGMPQVLYYGKKNDVVGIIYKRNNKIMKLSYWYQEYIIDE